MTNCSHLIYTCVYGILQTKRSMLLQVTNIRKVNMISWMNDANCLNSKILVLVLLKRKTWLFDYRIANELITIQLRNIHVVLVLLIHALPQRIFVSSQFIFILIILYLLFWDQQISLEHSIMIMIKHKKNTSKRNYQNYWATKQTTRTTCSSTGLLQLNIF